MNGPEHYSAAEENVGVAHEAFNRVGVQHGIFYALLANAHATLALCAATADPNMSRRAAAWADVLEGD